MTDNNVVELPGTQDQDQTLVADIKEALDLYLNQFLQEGARGFSIIAHYPDAPALPGLVNINQKADDANLVMALELLKTDLIERSRMEALGHE